MRKFFEKLRGWISRAYRWTKDAVVSAVTRNPIARGIARLYRSAVIRSANPILYFFYGRWNWLDSISGTRFGRFMVSVIWRVSLLFLMFLYPVYDGARWLSFKVYAGGRVVVRSVAFAVAGVWALFSLVMTTLLSVVTWGVNTLRNWGVRMWLWAWRGITRSPEKKQYTYYRSLRSVLAYFLGGLITMHAGGARFARRVIGDGFTWWLVREISDLVARLHPATYDFWFDKEMPYETPVESAGMLIRDGVTHEEEPPVSDKDAAENFYRNAGFVLISEEKENKTDAEVFNEHMRQRWANVEAAEIATDRYGRTWAVPKPGAPLLRNDTSLAGSVHSRHRADEELAWLEEKDEAARSVGYGRHWVAALADLDDLFLLNPKTQRKERALFAAKMKGFGQRIDRLQALRGYDEKLSEMLFQDVPPNVPNEPVSAAVPGPRVSEENPGEQGDSTTASSPE